YPVLCSNGKLIRAGLINRECVMERAVPIRVAIVDDHLMVRRGLAIFLDAFDDMVLVGETSSGKEAVTLCATVNPHVMLVDLMMPEMSGIATIRAVRDAFPTVKIVAMISLQERDLVGTALQAGADGYLVKHAPIDEIAQVIRTANASKPSSQAAT